MLHVFQQAYNRNKPGLSGEASLMGANVYKIALYKGEVPWSDDFLHQQEWLVLEKGTEQIALNWRMPEYEELSQKK